MKLLTYIKNETELRLLYLTQYEQDISNFMSPVMHNWYSLVNEQKQIVAECSTSIKEGWPYFQIDDVEVVEVHRGKGVCKLLIQAVIDDILADILTGSNILGITIQADPNTPQNTCYGKVFQQYITRFNVIVQNFDSKSECVYTLNFS